MKAAKLTAIITSILASGCASTSTTTTAQDPTTDSPTRLTSTEPLSADSVRLTVSGLSCPQCASNLTLTLDEVPGVVESQLDLATGEVFIEFGIVRPSPKQIADAVEDSGFTLVSFDVAQGDAP